MGWLRRLQAKVTALFRTGSELPKVPVLIWGCNDFSLRLAQLLGGSPIEIVGFVDHGGEDKFYAYKKFTPQQIKDSFAMRDIPIVVATAHLFLKDSPVIDFESVAQFKAKLQELIREEDIQNPLLHPAALTDYMDLYFPNKVVPFGLPGSGITLLSNLCVKIMEYDPKKFTTKDYKSRFFEQMCHEYTQAIRQTLCELSYLLDGYNLHVSSWKIGTTYAHFSRGKQRIFLYSFNTRNHTIGPVFAYHQMPSTERLRSLHTQGYKLFFSMRNPLDAIVSVMRKSNQIQADSEDFDFEKFCTAARWIIDQLRAWQPSVKELQTFHYDHIVAKPIKEIKRIMRQLNVRPKRRTAKKIWKELGFKQLPNAPRKHFWQGGAGKWQKYFKAPHLSFLKFYGIEEILESFGYKDLLRDFRVLTHNLSAELWRKSCSAEYQSEMVTPVGTLYGDEAFDTLAFAKKFHGPEYIRVTDKLYIAANNAPPADLVNEIVQAKFLNQLVAAGAHPDKRYV